VSQLTPEIVQWIKEASGKNAHLLSARQLRGSTSATLYHLTLLRGAVINTCVLRLFTNREWLAVEPDIPEHEAAALEKVHAAGLPVPRLIACDPRGAACGLPALLMTSLPGKVDLLPENIESWLHRQAEFLVRLHAITPGDFAWKYRPYYKPAELAVPAWSKQPQLWEKAIEIVRSPAPAFATCFIHRDYHPVNLLWRRGKLSGVVDWVNSCLGPAGVDVAWARHNLAAMYGLPMANRWLEVCNEVLGSTWQYDPYWDIQTLMEVLPGPPEVYAPWHDFGLDHLNEPLVIKRLEDYLASLLK
jgi:aminoglycoside phosphotransferase (APT) family kinase protein